MSDVLLSAVIASLGLISAFLCFAVLHLLSEIKEMRDKINTLEGKVGIK